MSTAKYSMKPDIRPVQPWRKSDDFTLWMVHVLDTWKRMAPGHWQLHVAFAELNDSVKKATLS